jgi:phage shock protein C
MKKLYKSRDNKVVAGVLGGMGEYFEVDPVLLRVGYIFLMIFTAGVPGVIAYALAAFVIPDKPESAPRA